MPETPSATRILVVRLGALGDLVICTAVLRALKTRFPGARISMVVQKGLGSLLQGNPHLDEIIEFDRKSDTTLAGALAFGKRLAASRFDLFLNLQFSAKTVVMRLATGARRSITYKHDFAVQPDGHRLHALDNFLRALSPLGIDPETCDRTLELHFPADASARADSLLDGLGAGGRPLVLLNPSTSAPNKCWPTERFADLARALALDVDLAILGAKSDQPLADEILGGAPNIPIRNLCGAMNLPELSAVIARGSVLVTGDTGPMHMAAALGTPTVSLFGPTDPFRTGPLHRPRTRNLVVIHDDPAIDCIPCLSRSCKRGDRACLRELPVARVEHAVREILR